MPDALTPSKDILLSWYWLGLGAAVGLLVGLVADFILQRYMKKFAARTTWEGDDLIIHALANKLPFWGLIAGMLLSLPFVPLPVKLMHGAQKGLLVVLIFWVTQVVSFIASGLIAVSATSDFGGSSTSIFRVLARIGVWGIGFTVLMHQLGINVAPILTALGVGGLAVALALQDTLSNLFAGIHIILSRQVRIGDYIRLDGGTEGYVLDINWRNTTVKAQLNNLIVIPNNKVSTAIVTNHALPEPELLLIVPVVVGYKNDLAKVETVTIEVAREVITNVPGGVSGAEPVVRFNAVNESTLGFNVIFRVQQFDAQFLIRHEFIKRLHQRYVAEGIDLPFPRRVVENVE